MSGKKKKKRNANEPAEATSSPDRNRWLPIALIAFLLLLVGVAYAPTLGPAFNSFVFDDLACITSNPTIGQLDPIWNKGALGVPVGLWRRPLPSWTLTIDYWSAGFGVWRYRITNIAIHMAASALLFGLAYSLTQTARANEDVRRNGFLIAFAVALLWALHPLQTESVAYVIQRIEALMGMFLFGMLLGLVRCATAERKWLWGLFSVACCFLGMISKEVMIVAPVVALLLDWTLLCERPRDLWRRVWLYAGYLPGAVLLIGMVLAKNPLSARPRHRAPGALATPLEYLATQAGVICKYLQQTVWPSQLCFDRNWEIETNVWAIVLPGALLTLLLAASVYLLVRRSFLGFLGVSFFLLLAPTSSIMPIGTVYFEHRMYAPLACLAGMFVLGAFALVKRGLGTSTSANATVALMGVLGVALLLTTRARNEVYRSTESLSVDSIAKDPNSWRSWHNLGIIRIQQGRLEEGIAACRRSIEAYDNRPESHASLANALIRDGRAQEAIRGLDAVREQFPLAKGLIAHQYALAYEQLGNWRLAEASFEEAIADDPDDADIWVDYAAARAARNELEAANRYLDEALRANSTNVEANLNKGALIMMAGGPPAQAVNYFRRALRLDPGNATAREYLERALRQ